MTLRDPNDPSKWVDGEPRSQNNAFDCGYVIGSRIDTKTEEEHARAKQRAADQVDRNRANGRDLSVAALLRSGKGRQPQRKAKA